MNPDFIIRIGSDASRVVAELHQLEAAAIRAQNRINATQTASARVAGAGAGGAAARDMQRLDAATRGAVGSQAALTTSLGRSNDQMRNHTARIGEAVLVYAALAAAAAGAASAISLAATIDTESRRLEAVLDLTPQQGSKFVRGLFETAVETATPVENILGESDLAASAFADLTNETEKQAAAQELLRRAGQVTTISQRDMATETANLIALMKLGNVEIDDLGTTLGQVTAAGDNSARSIAAIFDALKISIPAANNAGVSLEQLIALIGTFRAETQKDGNEIGSIFSTLFQTITNEKAQNNISDLTGGLVDLRDEAGNLRPALEILLQVRSLIDSGAIDPGKLQEIFKAFAPPLNPGAAKDIKIIFDLLDQLPAALREVETTGASALDGLVNKLNAAIGPQFRILIEEIKLGFNDLFSEDIIGGGQTLIDLMRSLGAMLRELPPGTIQLVAGMVGIAVAMQGIVFVGGRLVSLLGLRGITGALAAASAQAVTAGTSFGFMSSMGLGLLVTLSKILPLLAAFMAFDLAGQIGAQQGALKSQIGGLTTGLDAAGLRALRGRLEEQKGPEFLEDANLLSLESLTTDPALNEGIAEIDRLLAELEKRGAGAKVTIDDLSDGFTGAGSASQEVTDAMASQTAEMERLIAGYTEGANATAGMTEAERIAAESAKLLEFTRKGQAADLETLSERLREGKISAEEFAQGQQIVAQAAELAAQLVAIAGDRLGEYPLFAEAAAAGQETLTARVYDMIVASGGSIGAIGGLIGQLGNLAAANAATATSLMRNPLVIRYAVTKFDPLSPERRVIPADSPLRSPSTSLSSATAAMDRQIKAILGSINNLVSGFGKGTSAFGNVPSIPKTSATPAAAAETRVAQPDILDLGDFDKAQLAEAIALAFRLQGSIPGATAAAQDDIFSIIKDAQFLQQVAGLDDELLRKSIEELTDVERARLELEKNRAATFQNLVVNQGSLSSLISQPFIFGNGGAMVGGTGLNSDPSQGQFNITFGDVNTTEPLTPAQLQTLVYSAISRALADAAKL